jgi:hypothetical protein
MTRVRRRARLTTGAAAVLGLAVALAGCGGSTGDEATPLPTPTPTTASGDGDAGAAGGTMPPVSFPVGSAVDALVASLPSGAAVADLPPDLGWGADASLPVPVSRDGTAGVVVVVVGPPCSASSALLTAQEASLVADEVCRVWEAEGRLPVVPADAGVPATADPQDAVR